MSVAPSRPSLRRSAAFAWRSLRSMRTALILLLMLALASVVGSLVPQEMNSPERVAHFMVDHPLLGLFYRKAGFFEVFGSWWFTLITTLLFVSLFACLIPRTRAAIRSARQRPVQAREIDAFPLFREVRVDAAPATVLAASRRVLSRRLFRTAAGETQVAAEKGTAREIGSLLFHWAFVLILLGVLVGKGTGYTGHAVIIEGQTFVDARANYFGQVRTGRFFTGNFSGIGIRLNSFRDTYRDTGIPMDFVSKVQLLDPSGAVTATADIRVNQPAHYEGMDIFQYGFGWAPVVEIRQGGRLLASGPVAMGQDTPPKDVPALALPWYGTEKLTTLAPNVGVSMEFWPDSGAFIGVKTTGQPIPMTTLNAPIIRFSTYEGRIFDTSRTLHLDTSLLRKVESSIVGEGQTIDLRTGDELTPDPKTGKIDYGNRLTISMPSVRKFTVLQVSRDRGVPIVLLAAILILVGLLPALYTARRKVWVRVQPAGTGSVVQIGGFALQRKTQFEEEFARLVQAVTEAAGGEVPREKEAAIP
ncbi:MAG: cytochrome c biosis protein [Actinomycetota bacterium]|nr:cytochrome c biosis protein [Actinomycetota bacterium]